MGCASKMRWLGASLALAACDGGARRPSGPTTVEPTTAARPADEREGEPRASATSSSVRSVFPEAPLDHWKLGPHRAHVLDGLRFGMDIESAWEAAPRLRDAMDVRLEPSQYEQAAERIPALGEGDLGGNRFMEYRHRDGRWPEVEGLTWELRFELERGLTMVTARFENREAIYEALGQPDLRARWEFWFDHASHTRAALTSCGPGYWTNGKPAAPATCKLEFMPFQSLDDHLQHIFPDDGTWVGHRFAELPFSAGYISDDNTTTFLQRPLAASLYSPLEVQPDAKGRVAGYRSLLSYRYNVDARPDYDAALAERIEGLRESAIVSACAVGSRAGVPVTVCHESSRFVLIVGAWRD